MLTHVGISPYRLRRKCDLSSALLSWKCHIAPDIESSFPRLIFSISSLSCFPALARLLVASFNESLIKMPFSESKAGLCE
jgi:hypothetical protein